jgi:cytochrome c biogenesis protein CcdA
MEYAAALGTALWLGVLTSISPCPLATNIAAISYIGRRLESRRAVLIAGLLYTLGRVAAYVGLGLLIIAGLLAIPALSNFLQKYMHQLLGPLLIVAGMFLLELISFNKSGGDSATKLGERAAGLGIWGALLLGFLFAMTFCPTSAALFFGSLIPLAVERSSRVMMPLIYGIGTALPVVVFALIIAFSAQALGKAFGALQKFELWARRVTGALFILIGIYLTLHYVFGVI